MNKTNVRIKELRKHYICGYYDLFGITYGYKIFPITYKEGTYIVIYMADWSDVYDKKTLDNLKMAFKIYEYNKEKKILPGCRGKLLYATENIRFIKINENLTIDIHKIFKKEMQMYLPQIMKCLFEEYEKFLSEKEETESQISVAKQWNGVVDELDSGMGCAIVIPELYKDKNAKEEDYYSWLENMVTMLSKNYLDLVHASDEKVLKSVPLPVSNATRKAIRMIAQNTSQIKGNLEDKSIEEFTKVLIEKQRLK